MLTLMLRTLNGRQAHPGRNCRAAIKDSGQDIDCASFIGPIDASLEACNAIPFGEYGWGPVTSRTWAAVLYNCVGRHQLEGDEGGPGTATSDFVYTVCVADRADPAAGVAQTADMSARRTNEVRDPSCLPIEKVKDGFVDRELGLFMALLYVQNFELRLSSQRHDGTTGRADTLSNEASFQGLRVLSVASAHLRGDFARKVASKKAR